MGNNVSCESHSYNAGNYYNYPAAALGNNASNSVCPKGWTLPNNAKGTSYSRLLEAYGIDHAATTKSNYDSGLVNLPLSFLRSGIYSSSGTLTTQGSRGSYRMTSQRLYFHSDSLKPTNSTSAYTGYSVRCVSR